MVIGDDDDDDYDGYISKPKVNDLEVPIAVQQKVFRFEVSVVNIVLLRMVKLVLWRILKILLCRMLKLVLWRILIPTLLLLGMYMIEV